MSVIFKNTLKYPYNLFFLTAILLLLVSLFQFGEVTDINFHDTYYVTPVNYLTWTLALIFIVLGALYKLLNRLLLNHNLSWIHVLTTILVLLLLKVWSMILPYIQHRGYTATTGFESSNAQSMLLMIIFIIFITGQVAFVANVVGGIGRYLVQKKFTSKGGG